MITLARILPDNPVLTKELRVRMRGARAYWILLGYLGFLSVLVLLQYWSFQQSVLAAGAGASNSGELGSALFGWIIVPQVFLVLFITPAITSGTLTIEREQQTMDMLSLTRLSRKSIVIGKLLSAVSFTALLIVSSLPLVSICFMLGSIDPLQVLSAYMEMLAASVLIGAMGIMWSSMARSTTQAVMMTYFTLALIFAFGLGVFSTRFDPINNNAGTTVFRAVSAVWFGHTFLGVKVPDGLGFTVMCVLVGLLMTAVATVRIEMFPHRKAYILRAMCLAVFGLQFFSLDKWWVDLWYQKGAGTMVAIQPPIGALMASAAALLVITPIFTTGEMASFEARRIFKYFLWGWSPAGLKRGKLASGLPFMMIAALLCLGVYAISFAAGGHGAAFKRSGALSLGLPGLPPPPVAQLAVKAGDSAQVIGNSVMVTHSDGSTVTAMPLPNGKVQVTKIYAGGHTTVEVRATWPSSVPAVPPPPVQTGTTPQTGDFAQAAIVLLSAVAGFSLLCIFLSVAFRTRWLAIVVAYVILLLVMVVPEIGLSSASGAYDTSTSVNLFYLNPIQPLLQMCQPATYWQPRFLWFGQTPMWLVVSYAWGAIGALSILLMAPFVRRMGRENAPIPYEELVQMS